MQRGQVYKTDGSWKYRCYLTGANGQRVRRQQGGFATRDEAIVALDQLLRQERLGPLAQVLYPEPVTLTELVDEYLAQHQAAASTIRTLEHRLGYAQAAFGGLDVTRITVREVRAWRARLPAGSARGIHQALRQALGYAVDVKLIAENPAAKVPNPRGAREEMRPFGHPLELELLADEIDQRYRALPVFAAATGLRPEEWIALERNDIDRDARVVVVRRKYAKGRLSRFTKTERSRRRVPLARSALDALAEQPARVDTPLVFPAPDGGHLNIDNFRSRSWTPALKSAGLEHHRIYDLRHTHATWAIAAGMPLYNLARFMGTSIEMIDRTYGHLFSDAEQTARDLLDTWFTRELAAGERG